MRASRDRDEEFRSYVVDSRARLVRTATFLSAGDAHLAEDLVQTALTRLYVAWPRIRRIDGPDAYVRRVLVNALIDEKRRPFWRRESPSAALPDTASLVHDIDHAPLLRALAELPPGMRAAVVFRHVHDFTVAETADALKCSEGNVKSQTARGLDRLRAALSGHPTGHPAGHPIDAPTDRPTAAPARPSGPAVTSAQPLNRQHMPATSTPQPWSSS